MADPITYARAGGPPDDWNTLVVRDRKTREPINYCCEVDTAEGWAIVEETDEKDHPIIDGDEIRRKRIMGDFIIEHRP